MNLYLESKTAIVTGASQGIGRAITRELAMEGTRVLAVARNEQLLADLENDIIERGGVKPVLCTANLMSPDAPKRIVQAALSAFGHVDILVNNAGRSQPMEMIDSPEKWQASMTLEFDRPRQLTEQLLPHFVEREQGTVLNIISTYELRSLNASAIAKAALGAWSKQLAGQVARKGIRINCLQPGLIDTENIRRHFPGEVGNRFAEKEIPAGYFGDTQDMANMAVFLVSPRARYVTGTITVVDGGMRHSAF
jgi:3-oxoacyl-[acyl-carrier protein] reductase